MHEVTPINAKFIERFPISGILTIPANEVKAECSAFAPHGTCILKLTLISSNWKPARYMLSVSQSMPAQLNLSPNELPATDVIALGEYKHYFLKVPLHTSTFTVTAIPLEGDIDLYLNFGNKTVPSTGKRMHQYRSNGWGNSEESITVTKDDLYFCDDCIASIAVYGFNQGPFNISVSMETSDQQQPAEVHNVTDAKKASFRWSNFFIGLGVAFGIAFGLYIVYALRNSFSRVSKPEPMKKYSDRERVHTIGRSSYVAPSLDVSREELLKYIAISEKDQFIREDDDPFFVRGASRAV